MTVIDADESAHDDSVHDDETQVTDVTLGTSDRWILASFSAAAGIVHVVMAPSHMGASKLEGGGFLLSAWLQLALAVGIVARPGRWMLRAVVLVNLGLIGLWAVSRTSGLPFGAHADHPESISFVDGSCVAFEVLLVALAALWLVRPGAIGFKGGAFAVGVPLAAFAVASAAIASPQARDHSAHSHGGHAGAEAAGAHGHGADGEPADDNGLALLENGHQHGTGSVEKLDAATQAELAAQLVRTAELVERFPTVGVAKAQGARQTGPFTPGLGTHFLPPDFQVNDDGVMDDEDLLLPILIFDGSEPDAPIAGFMYYMMGSDVPEGFAGDNDYWHYHTNTCMITNPDGTVDTPYGADDTSITEEMCDEIGGEMLQTTGYMVHVWTVPGYESDRGVFGDINPKITCPDGTYFQIPWSEVGMRDTFCRNP